MAECYRYPCIYRGRGLDTGHRYDGCRGGKFVVLWACHIFGRCTISHKLPRVAKCSGCKRRDMGAAVRDENLREVVTQWD